MVDIGPLTYQSVFSGKIREAYVFICNNLLPLERLVKLLTLSLFYAQFLDNFFFWELKHELWL